MVQVPQKIEHNSQHVNKPWKNIFISVQYVYKYPFLKQIDINVSGYTENDLNIDMTGDNELTVSGQTELVIDGKNAKKRFSKPYTIPEGLDLSKIRVVVSDNQINISIPKIVSIFYKTYLTCF